MALYEGKGGGGLHIPRNDPKNVYESYVSEYSEPNTFIIEEFVSRKIPQNFKTKFCSKEKTPKI